jgi:hypothetical protein
MQGGTVEWVVVLASLQDLTAGWSYSALSRVRGATRLLIADTRATRPNGPNTRPTMLTQIEAVRRSWLEPPDGCSFATTRIWRSSSSRLQGTR